jgi:hypothetical protein
VNDFFKRQKSATVIDRRYIAWFALAFAAITTTVRADAAASATAPPIDRAALVARHNPTAEKADPLSPFSVGNGAFAFTADITGLQSFPETYETGIPLHTLSDWGWHTAPNPHGYKPSDAVINYPVGDREIPYASGAEGKGYSAAADWLRANPQRIDLGRIGFVLFKANGERVQVGDLQEIHQKLDLWTGILESRFKVEGQPVTVETVCHPDLNLIAVHIESPLLEQGRLKLELAFSYPSDDFKTTSLWDKPDAHQTTMHFSERRCDFARTLDADHYFATITWSGEKAIKTITQHHFTLTPPRQKAWDFTVAFSPKPIFATLPDFAQTRDASIRHWKEFWSTGGAVDLSGSTDPRAPELERRIVLSQYLTAVNCDGSMPPQETGLTCDSWYGKAHLEMHWWHAAHFALWGRAALLEKSMAWYENLLPKARALAQQQGFTGARWPKMVGPDGVNSPSKVAAFLIWEQPHPIYYAELLYRAHPDAATLKKYQEMVFETAEFMASFPVWDAPNQRFVLGPQMIPAQEIYGKDREHTINPTFELAYWSWALETAQQWRLRLGLAREPKWDNVLHHLSHPTVRDGVYAGIETAPYTVTEDHPSMLAALGMVPATPLIDPAIMSRTLDQVMKTWNWPTTWGWDYPMMAMTAARVGRPGDAVSLLLMDTPKNTYLPNGHNYQDARLPLYLPGNGGLLAAIALMAAGWDGAPPGPAPGFPHDGTWRVRFEDLQPMP